MPVIVVTGSQGLIGSETALHFGQRGYDVVGIDNDMRGQFLGVEGSTSWNQVRVASALGRGYEHHRVDVRDSDGIDRIFRRFGRRIELIVHTAAQPSHDWSAREPATDFTVNAVGTLALLEAARRHAADSVFVLMSADKVYGDKPNALPLVEQETRWEIQPGHPFERGIPETFGVDQCLHSPFGVSKLAADALVQEYGRYYGMRTVCFRGGTITGPQHSCTELHGFLAYLMKCASTGRPYTIFGYEGKQVRDVIHAADVVRAFDAFAAAPRAGEVYNLGGGRASNCSVREAIALAEEISGRPMRVTYSKQHRRGDHVWYISDCSKFRRDYPGWTPAYADVRTIARELHEFQQAEDAPRIPAR